jgi:hypothetical protein
MLRVFAFVCALSCLVGPVSAQTQSAQAPPATHPAKSSIKKPAKAKAAAATDSGPCGVGVITAGGDQFTVQKIGITVFGNETTEVPVPWGLDDLIFARIRAAANGIPVRRITYAKGAFDSYYHPKPNLFRNAREELTTLVREIAGNAGCERYFAVVRFEAKFQGTNQLLSGVGIVNRGTSLFSRSYLFANIGVIVFDGQTFDIRKDPHANFQEVLERVAANLIKDNNLRELDDSAFPASPPEAANSATLRDGARALLTEKLDKILPAYFKE